MTHTKKFFTTIFGALLLLAPMAPADCKGSPKALPRRVVSKRSGNYLIPPPPANMPSILPELSHAETASNQEPEQVKKNPYKKYVYTKQGHEEPAPVQPNKYVTYWNKS